jgi:hypothetical protein
MEKDPNKIHRLAEVFVYSKTMGWSWTCNPPDSICLVNAGVIGIYHHSGRLMFWHVWERTGQTEEGNI